jgi:hypothetical protein
MHTLLINKNYLLLGMGIQAPLLINIAWVFMLDLIETWCNQQEHKMKHNEGK